MPINILTIAGSDPSSGAGVQRDIKTFNSHQVYGFTAITAVTSQNTKKFQKVEPISSQMVGKQIDSIFEDFKIDAIKIGMVYNKSIIKTVYSKLKNVKLPIIVDPVITSTTGGQLLQKNSLEHFKKFIVPIAYVITPNVFEAEKISGLKVSEKIDLERCARKIKKMGARNVVITGFAQNDKMEDFVLEDRKNYFVLGKKIQKEIHGSGCIFSATLAVAIAQGKNIQNAVKFAKRFSFAAIRGSIRIGKGIEIGEAYSKKGDNKSALEESILKFTKIRNVSDIIPECQTNFVFTKNNPKSIKDVLGIDGRIVRAGRKVIPSGVLKFGGSKHVASAMVEINKKFPSVKSAINIKYDLQLIKKMREIGFSIASYNRAKEPKKLKQKENSSISWGIKNAIKNSKNPPDAVYHTGDFGKEPMILIFGKDPDDVVGKISRVLKN